MAKIIWFFFTPQNEITFYANKTLCDPRSLVLASDLQLDTRHSKKTDIIFKAVSNDFNLKIKKGQSQGSV